MLVFSIDYFLCERSTTSFALSPRLLRNLNPVNLILLCHTFYDSGKILKKQFRIQYSGDREMKTNCKGLVRIFRTMGADHKFSNSLWSECLFIKCMGLKLIIPPNICRCSPYALMLTRTLTWFGLWFNRLSSKALKLVFGFMVFLLINYFQPLPCLFSSWFSL